MDLPSETKLVLMASLASSWAIAGQQPSTEQPIPANLGESVHELVLRLGPPSDVRLSGTIDGGYAPRVGDDLVLSWFEQNCVFGKCDYFAYFPDGSSALSRFGMYVEGDSLPSIDEVAALFPGEKGRVLRFADISEDGAIEAELSTCTWSGGEYAIYMMPGIGLEGFIEYGDERVRTISLSLERRDRGWPTECEPSVCARLRGRSDRAQRRAP